MSIIATMTSRQRILAAFAGETTDRVPIAHIGFSSKAASLILGREAYVGGGVQQWREAVAISRGAAVHQEFVHRTIQDAAELNMRTGQDLFRLEYWRLSEKPTAQIDEHTFLFGDRLKDWRIQRYDPQTEMFPIIEQGGFYIELVQTVEELDQYVTKLEEEAARNTQVATSLTTQTRDLLAQYANHAIRFHGGFMNIPYDVPIWLEAALDRPDVVERYLELRTVAEIRRIESLTAGGAKLIFGGGDFASNTGPFYSPQVFRDLVQPRLRRITDACHKAGAYFLFASDGDLWPVAEDLFGCSGVDGYYEIDRRAGMDLRKLRTRFPNLTLVGGNISSHTLSQGTPMEVESQTRDCLEVAAELGRIVVGISNYVTPETPRENMFAMLDTIARYQQTH